MSNSQGNRVYTSSTFEQAGVLFQEIVQAMEYLKAPLNIVLRGRPCGGRMAVVDKVASVCGRKKKVFDIGEGNSFDEREDIIKAAQEWIADGGIPVIIFRGKISEMMPMVATQASISAMLDTKEGREDNQPIFVLGTTTDLDEITPPLEARFHFFCDINP